MSIVYKHKRYCPTLRIKQATSNKEKIKKGQKVRLEGVVSGFRDDSYGKFFTVEVHKLYRK